MKIVLDAQTAIQLRAWTIATKMEFSGLADAVRYNGDILVSNANVLDVGTFGFTDFTPEMIMKLAPSTNRRCWFHRHPINCWSGTDIYTMQNTPCGSLPEMIAWSIAIVWTPEGWLGRLDTFVPARKHFDLEVVEEELYPIKASIDARAVTYGRDHDLMNEANILRAEFDKRHKNACLQEENIPTETKQMTSREWRKLHENEWPEVKATVTKKATHVPQGPAIHINYEQPRPAPKKKKNILQKTFGWLLDKPKGD